MNVVEILETLRETPGKNDKIEIIRENMENAVFMKVLDATLNPYYTYYIKQIPKVDSYSGTEDINRFMSFLHLFKNREVTGHEARDALQKLLKELTPEEASIAVNIIRKDLGAGVAASSVNKATGRMTIPIYPCLKATKFSMKAFEKIVYPAWSQIKADGMRANLIMRSTNDLWYGKNLRSRSGKFIDLNGTFNNVAAPFIQVKGGAVLDGELRLLEDDGQWMDRKKGNGLLNKAIRGTVTDDIVERVRFIAWDLIPIGEFDAFGEQRLHDNPMLYNDRWECLERFINEANDPRIMLSENKIVNDYGEALEHYRSARDRNEEGTIVKNINHVWTGKVSQHLVKLKSVKDCDLRIIGWEHGKAGRKWEQGVGSIICASDDDKVIVSVAGLSDEFRAELLENFDDYMGRIVAIEYNERINDKSRPEVDSLFSPRLLELREDKDEADKSEDIK